MSVASTHAACRMAVLLIMRFPPEALRLARASHISFSVSSSTTTISGSMAAVSRGNRYRDFILPMGRVVIPSNIVLPTTLSPTMPKPTSPLPDLRPSGSGLNPNAAAAAGQAIPSPSSNTCAPCLALISAWQYLWLLRTVELAGNLSSWSRNLTPTG